MKNISGNVIAYMNEDRNNLDFELYGDIEEKLTDNIKGQINCGDLAEAVSFAIRAELRRKK